MRQKSKLLFSVLVLLVSMLVQQAAGQSLKKQAQLIKTSIDQLDLDSFINIYADTVHYLDPNFGSENYFPRATIKEFMKPLFDKNGSFDLKLYTTAIDENEGSILIRGDAYDKTADERLPFVVFLKLKNGRVVQQIDFPVYAVESLRNAPRYKGYFKEKGG